jgi:hypothetical protein
MGLVDFDYFLIAHEILAVGQSAGRYGAGGL